MRELERPPRNPAVDATGRLEILSAAHATLEAHRPDSTHSFDRR
jgi:hypothetical protein